MAVPPSVPAAPVSLYVGDLNHDVSDGQLYDAFKDFPSIASVRVCRDSSTGRSLCYGYVNFMNPQDAIRAIETMNHTLLNGKLVRVMSSHRDPDARRSGIGNVFVKNLSESVDNAALQDVFQSFGNILSCKVVMSEDGKSLGYGFVQFESDESANSSIEKLNGTKVGDKQIYVGKFVRRSDRVLSGADTKYTNLYVKNLDDDITEDFLKAKFSSFGKIASLVISKDENGISRGFGFVNFENPDDARHALEAMHGSELGGTKALYVARAQKKAEREHVLRREFEEKRKEQIMKYKGLNVYVKNIDDDVSEEELRELFGQCGTITSAKLMCDYKGISRGFGFVCFSNPDEASKAVASLHSYMLRRKPLYVAIAQRKEDRVAQLQLQYAHRLAGLAGPPATLIPGGYPPMYYAAPPGIVSQVPARPGLMYQPIGLRPGWRAGGYIPSPRPTFQPSPLPGIPNAQRLSRPNRGRVNGQMLALGVRNSMPHGNRPIPLKDSSNLQRTGQVKYVPNGRSREMNKEPGTSSAASDPVIVGSEGSEMLSSLLAAAAPEQQKRILGERLYPLVEKHKQDLASKITGMLLEMDNSELLLLLESPESLAAKVEEAIQVLKLSKAKVPGQDCFRSGGFLSAEVAVS